MNHGTLPASLELFFFGKAIIYQPVSTTRALYFIDNYEESFQKSFFSYLHSTIDIRFKTFVDGPSVPCVEEYTANNQS